MMDLVKIGNFLKELRKEKKLTQEQFAEIMHVSGRTVSRWETGSNMPDMDVLICISEFYDVDLREILNGERKGEKMNEEMKETTLKVAEYGAEEKKRLLRRLSVMFFIGIVCELIWLALEAAGLTTIKIYDDIASACAGFAFGMLIIGFLYTTGVMMKIKSFKQRLLNK